MPAPQRSIGSRHAQVPASPTPEVDPKRVVTKRAAAAASWHAAWPRGVVPRGRGFAAKFGAGGNSNYLGYFDDRAAAAEAYAKAAEEYATKHGAVETQAPCSSLDGRAWLRELRGRREALLAAEPAPPPVARRLCRAPEHAEAAEKNDVYVRAAKRRNVNQTKLYEAVVVIEDLAPNHNGGPAPYWFVHQSDAAARVFVVFSNADAAREARRRPANSATSGTLSVLSGRLSYTLGLTGPCMTTDTACSSSLVAAHLAVSALKLDESPRAAVAGIGVLTLAISETFSAAGMLSALGRCHTLDRRADGYCRGEGCGAFCFSSACDDVAVFGSAVQQDGPSASLTAPNGSSQ